MPKIFFIFFITAIFLFAGLIFSNNYYTDNLKNVLADLNFIENNDPSSKIENRNRKPWNADKIRMSIKCFDSADKASGVTRGIEISYNYSNYLQNLCLTNEIKEKVYPRGFDTSKPHFYFHENYLSSQICEFIPGKRANRINIEEGVFEVYDDVEAVVNAPPSFYKQKFRVLAQVAGPEYINKSYRTLCGVLLFNNLENFENKLIIKTPRKYKNQRVIKDNTKITRRVHVVVYDPLIDGEKLSVKNKWLNGGELTKAIASYFRQVSKGTLDYRIVKVTNQENFPEQIDSNAIKKGQNPKGETNPDFTKQGFTYTEETYKKCLEDSNNCHKIDLVNYVKLADSLNACEDVNSGKIDEVWLVGGPFFGFYESHIIGTKDKSFFLNSFPSIYTKCEKPLVVMGFNYQRNLNMAIHNFVHRAESAIHHNFGLSRIEKSAAFYGTYIPERSGAIRFFYHDYYKSSNYWDESLESFNGCGNAHFTPGSKGEYIYDSPGEFLTNCREFQNFPLVKNTYKKTTCQEWGCTESGFYRYWWTNLPKNRGTYFDKFKFKEIKNNWWYYVFDIK